MISGRESSEMVERSFYTYQERSKWDISQNWLTGMRVEPPRIKSKEQKEKKKILENVITEKMGDSNDGIA